MNRTKTVFLIFFLMSLAIPVLPGKAPTHSYAISNINDDIFITETGTVFFNTPLIVMQDTGMDVIVVLLFRNVAIPQGVWINDANLTITTNSNFIADLDANATIYGVDADNLENLEEPHIYPATSNLVNWNISQVTGINVQHSVNITTLIQEVVNRPGWQSGNNLGLRIDSLAGDALRHFIARDFKPNQAATISITFNEMTPGPWEGTGQADYNHTVYPYQIWWYDQTVYENFTKYVLGADTQNRITNKDDFNITWSTLSRSDNDAEGHYQYGVGVFQDFEHYFTFQMTNVINISFRQVNVIAYHQNVYDSENHYFTNNLDMFAVGYRTFAGSPHYYHLDLVEVTGGARNIVAGTVNFRSNDILYCVLNKTNTALRLDVYTDIRRENLNYTITLTLSSDWDFRRIQIPQCLELAPSSPNNGYLDRLAIGDLNTTYVVTLNGTVVFTDPDPEDIEDWLEANTTPHPLDPTPPGYDETGIFTRFNMRLMILMLGLFCIFAPSAAMAHERPSAYFAVMAIFVIIIGIGLLMSIPEI